MNTQPDRTDWKKASRLPMLLLSTLGIFACFLIFIFVGILWSINRNGKNTVEQSALFPDRQVPSLNSADKAALQDLRGLVEIQDGAGPWEAAAASTILSAGAHIRTGALSSAKILFNDGSQVLLGSDSEIVLDELQAPAKGGARRIALTQVQGESQHDVAPSTDAGSNYEVHTAAATGSARGTQFKVAVRPDQSALFSVTEGKVAVTGQDVTVDVGAGQATTAALDQPPEDPQFFFTGQGEVSLIGDTWVVAGQLLVTHPATVVIGSPQVGDTVFYEGRLQADGTRLVDLILLLRRSPANRFTLNGKVDAINGDFWTVSGQEIAVTDITKVDAGILQGDQVHVEGIILAGGTLQAEIIRKLEEAPGQPFDFTGVIQEIGSETWKISGIEISVTISTTIDEGLAAGELVQVTGWILDSGVWQAGSIKRSLDGTQAFELVGKIESQSPWKVTGVSFETRDWTEIDPGLIVGDQVRVKGQVLEGGVWVAYEIHRLEDPADMHIFLVGIVFGKDPWIVSGIPLTVTAETVIVGEINIGMLVRVEIEVQADGSWKVLKIEPLDSLIWMNNCHDIVAHLVSVNGNQIQLEGWPLLSLKEGAEVNGELKPGSIVVVQVCYDESGNLVIVTVYILLAPPDIEQPPAELPGGKATICHKPNGKNPHTLVVSQAAVPAHLGHGDHLGPCP